MRILISTLALPAALLAGGCQFSPLRSWGAVPDSALPGRCDTGTASEAVGEREAADGLFVGLALSGGGSRAAVFSAEVLQQLAALGVTDRIDYVSAVSGGALAGAAWCLSRDPGDPPDAAGDKRFVWTDEFVRSAFTRDFVAVYQMRQVSPIDFLRYWFTGYNRAARVADTFDSALFHGRRLGDLNPRRPRLLINCTRVNDGRRFSFTDQQLAGLNIRAADLRAADAVGASSAVPGLFNARAFPQWEPDEHGGWRLGAYHHLSDGVARDNLGIEALMHVYLANKAKFPKGAVILISDATRPDVSPPNIGELPDLRRGFDYLYDSRSASAAAAVLLDIIREDTLWHLAAAGRDKPIRFVHFYYPEGLPGAPPAGRPRPKTIVEGPAETVVRLRDFDELNGKFDLLVPTDLRISQEHAESVRRAARTVVEHKTAELRELGLTGKR